MPKSKIIIVDDQPMISVLMKEIIEESSSFEVVNTATTREEFLDLVSQHSYDIALVDISLGKRDGGLDILKTLKERNIPLTIVMISAHDEAYYGLKCLQLGAKGYINKEAICNDLIRGLEAIVAGNLFVSGDNGKIILEEYQIGLS